MITRRIAQRDDRTILRIVRNELLPYTERTMPGITVDRQTLSKRLSEGTTFVLLRKGIQPVGFVCCLLRGKTLNIDMLAVDRHAQGRGLGSRLMEAAESFGRRNKCTKAVLYVDQANRGAQRFYVRKGYVTRQYIDQYDTYELEKPLR
ncbi:GNAT family N-acetyltransferase [Paenibacillus koleovorans]|uniref:GNAT family N-acetyltransferase n=1 Tax=Paenibacillus koleovorans TaxID=121608 RepID=UPI000FDA0CAF|nr:GNAT family N-acetyltransferase [Paenibacillus koleovorans]